MLDVTNIIETIEKRFSCRGYRDIPIDGQRREQLEGMVDGITTGPLGSRARFVLVSAAEDDRSALKRLGTYGFIRGATAFIIGASKPARYDMEDFGYLMEEIILYAAQLDLGTCWLGGTFTRSRFAEKIQLLEDETLPAVTAAGIMADQRNWMERLIRFGASSNHRLSWGHLFFDGAFHKPLDVGTVTAYATPLEMVRLAPSASNRQPWRIVKENDRWHFYLQRTPKYPPSAARLADLQRVDMGIAMCHFALSAAALELRGHWENSIPEIAFPDVNTEYVITWVEDG